MNPSWTSPVSTVKSNMTQPLSTEYWMLSQLPTWKTIEVDGKIIWEGRTRHRHTNFEDLWLMWSHEYWESRTECSCYVSRSYPANAARNFDWKVSSWTIVGKNIKALLFQLQFSTPLNEVARLAVKRSAEIAGFSPMNSIALTNVPPCCNLKTTTMIKPNRLMITGHNSPGGANPGWMPSRGRRTQRYLQLWYGVGEDLEHRTRSSG